MEHKLMLGALGLGGIGWACLLLLTASRRGASVSGGDSSLETPLAALSVRRSFKFLAFLLPILIWMATLPTKTPFSSGQGWGRGFLLGGLLAFFSVWGMFRAVSRRASNPRAMATISLFGALIAASVPLLWMRSAVIEALLGAALAWIAVSLVWLLGIESPQYKDSIAQNPFGDAFSTLILNGAAFAATLLGAAALGVYRDFVFNAVARGTYSAVALTLAASIALVFLIDALLSEIAQRSDSNPIFSKNSGFSTFSNSVTTLFGWVAPLLIGTSLATKFLNDLALVYVILSGLILGALLWLLVRDDAAQTDVRPIRIPMAAIIVALCGFMFSYQLMQGFGVGLMLICAWPIALLALPTSISENVKSRAAKWDAAQMLSLLACFGAILLLSRLFATRFRADLRGAGFDDQFALFGFVAGAILPSLLASAWFETRGAEGSSRSLWRLFPASATLARLFCLGIVALAGAGAMLALWGAKVVPAFLVGLALAVVGFIPSFASRIGAAAAGLFALSLALLVTQWTQRLLPLAEISRAQRLHFLWWSLGGVVVLLLVVDYGARLLFWMKNRGALDNSSQSGVSL